MNKFKAIFLDSLLEIKSSKMLYLYGIITLFMSLIILIIPNIDIDGQGIFGGEELVDSMASGAAAMFFSGFLGFMVFLIYLGSAWLMPSFLRKGRIELALSKPIGRINLLSMKFISVYLIKTGILTIVALIIWLVLALRLELPHGSMMAGLIAAWIDFLVIYGIIFSLGVLTRSGAFALMGYFILKVVAGLLASRDVVSTFFEDSLITTIIDGLYHILPKFGEMSESLNDLVSGDPVEYYPIISTIGFTIVLYLITLLVFKKRDY
jgi:ABC-type transport system involved in multi-copper enzyme maturation permease subunit